MKEFFRDFLLSFNRRGVIREWAFYALMVSLVTMTMGVCHLAMYYTGLKYINPTTNVIIQPSLVTGWIITLFGCGLYAGSSFGIKFPEKEKVKKKGGNKK